MSNHLKKMARELFAKCTPPKDNPRRTTQPAADPLAAALERARGVAGQRLIEAAQEHARRQLQQRVDDTELERALSALPPEDRERIAKTVGDVRAARSLSATEREVARAAGVRPASFLGAKERRKVEALPDQEAMRSIAKHTGINPDRIASARAARARIIREGK